MANVTGPQPDVLYCPICKSDLKNVLREDMKSKGYISRRTGKVADDTHTYQCAGDTGHRFEINQAR